MLGPTVYTFSIILAVFLTGLGIGSALGSFLARGAAQPRLALGTCQMLLAAAIAGPPSCSPIPCPFGRSIPFCRRVRGSTSSLTCSPRVGHLSGNLSVGRQFPAGACQCRLASTGRGTIGRGRICGEYSRRGRRRGHVQPVSHPPLWDSAGPAPADRDLHFGLGIDVCPTVLAVAGRNLFRRCGQPITAED